MHTIPTLETPRLRLRAFRADDFNAIADFFGDPVSAPYGGPCNRDEAWRKLAAYCGHWSLRGYGPWAVGCRATDRCLGVCGLWYPEGWFAPEITWALVPGEHGKGYATEAASRALTAAYEHFGWTTAVSVVAQGNAASEAVARRLGATAEQTIVFRGGSATVFRHRAPA
jgi:RimJ/RimL family protein N-acetyltransferase